MARLDAYEVNDAMERWNRLVVGALSASANCELLPGQEVTNKTIVSFRVRSSNGSFMSHDALTRLYRDLCDNPVDGLNGYDRVLIGQPVRYGAQSFLRVALGSSDLRRFVEQGFRRRQRPSTDRHHQRTRTRDALRFVSDSDIETAYRRAVGADLLDDDDTVAIFVDMSIIDDRLDRLNAAFPPDTLHAVAVKTHPLAAVLRHVVDPGVRSGSGVVRRNPAGAGRRHRT